MDIYIMFILEFRLFLDVLYLGVLNFLILTIRCSALKFCVILRDRILFIP